MKLERKIRILIFFCIFVLAGLVSIQYYLIQHTYNYQKEQYLSEFKDSLGIVLNSFELTNLEISLSEEIRELALEKAMGKIDERRLHTEIKKNVDSVRKLSDQYLADKRNEFPILKDVKLKNRISEIILKYGDVTDTILSPGDSSFVVYGVVIDSKKKFNFSGGTTFAADNEKFDGDGNLILDKFNYRETHSIDYNITNNWEIEVFSRMAWMLAAAMILLTSVILLFFWIFRSLIRQKRISEIKSDFVNNITHELKTPLASLNIVTSALEKEKSGSNPDLVSLLSRQNLRIQNIIDRILEASMIERGAHKKWINIVKFLYEFAGDYRSGTHLLKLDIKPHEFFLRTDTYQLERVLRNLVENAQKYSPWQKEIIMRSYFNESYFIIEIQDFGNGVPLREQERIFKKFYRISQGNKHDVKGLGLGLYLSKELMKELGGTLSLKKSSEKGSIFMIKLPT